MRALLLLAALPAFAQTYDTAINSGRVIDPESKLDDIRHIGIRDGKIAAISTTPLGAATVIDAKGLVASPGFIDLHSHGQDAENYRAKAMDGVTTALECEIGTAAVNRWYSERSGKALIHYGVTIGHPPVRMQHFGDSGAFLPVDKGVHSPSSEEDISAMARLLEQGLQQGAVGVGFGIAYTPAASALELLTMFRLAARFDAPAFVHVNSGLEGLNEVVGYAATTGAPLHVVHLNSSGGRRNTPHYLKVIEDARRRGMDITTECYPYTAGQTNIASAIFADGWQKRLGISYPDLLWTASGERLTAESFARYRKSGGSVITFTNTEEMVQRAVESPLTIIASDGILRQGKGHPRSTGTYAKVLATYVRDKQVLSLADAIRKMTLMPAQRLETRVPAMRNKGRIRIGADADLAIFDPLIVRDRSTYTDPTPFAEGFRYVLVNGVAVVRNGRLDESRMPGQPVRR